MIIDFRAQSVEIDRWGRAGRSPEFSGLSTEQCIRRSLVRGMRQLCQEILDVEINPVQWDELLDALDARGRSDYRVEFDATRAILKMGCGGWLHTVVSAADVEYDTVRIT